MKKSFMTKFKPSITKRSSLEDTDKAANLLSGNNKKDKTDKKTKKSANDLLNTTLHAKKQLVIEVSKYDTQIAEVAVAGNTKSIKTTKLKVFNIFSIKNPDGTWDGNKLSNIKGLSSLIIQTLKERKINTKRAVWVIHSESILTRDYDKFPLQPAYKTNIEIVKNKKEELFPINIDDYFLDYKVVEEYTSSTEQKKLSFNSDIKDMLKSSKTEKLARVQIYAAPKKLVESYYRLAKACQLDTVEMDFSGQSMVNISEYIGYNLEKDGIIIDIDYDYTSIYDIVNGKLAGPPRKVQVGYESIVSKALSSTSVLGSNIDDIYESIYKNNLLTDEDELERFIASHDTGDVSLISIINDIRYEFETLLEQVSVELEVLNRKKKDSVESVYIIDRLEYFPDLTEDIKQISNVDVRYIKELDVVQNKAVETIAPYIHIIGSCFNTVNFKLDSENEIKVRNKIKQWLIILNILTIVVIAVISVNLNIKLDDLKTEQADLERQIDNANLADVIAKRARKSEYAKNTLLELKNKVVDASTILTDIEKITPSNAYYNSVVMQNNTVILDIVTADRDECIRILDELEELEYYSSITTPGITEITNQATGGISYNMVVTCEIKNSLTEDSIDADEVQTSIDESSDEQDTDTELGDE